MNPIKVAIVDSGMDLKHLKFEKIKKNVRSYNVMDGSNKAQDQDLGAGKGHGTGIFSILCDHIKKDIEKFDFLNIKIFDEKGHTTEDYLLQAINYCIEQKVDIINLSLGIETNSPSKELLKICEQAHNAGIILIAATSDNNVKTFPAYFPFVLGVTGGVISKRSHYGSIKSGPIRLIGKGNLQRVADLDGKNAFVSGNSQAAAHITGITCNIVLNHKDWSKNKVEKFLLDNGRDDVRIFTNRFMQYVDPMANFNYRIKTSQNSNDKIHKKLFDFKERFSWIKKIAIYPLSNKEMRAFTHFSDLCPFEISEVYDFPRFAVKDKTIKINGEVKSIKWDIDDSSLKDVDTIVIGHPYDTALEINTTFADKIIEKCISEQKNFFVFDKMLYLELKNRLKDYSSVIYYPNNFTELIDLTRLLEFDKIKLPNLSVVGVTPQSGKFTTQLVIKQTLEKEGYKTAWLSTEPQGELFGADVCMPVGGEINSMTIGPWPYFLPAIVSGLEKFKKADIFISGHQSGLVQQYKNYFQQDTLNSINFLASIRADGVICAVNPAYACDQLDRVVTTLESLFQLPVLFFTLSRKMIKPQQVNSGGIHIKNKMLNDEEWQKIADDIYERYNVPVIDPLREEHKHIILEQITNFFN